MATKRAPKTEIATTLAAEQNRIFRAQVTLKSGTVNELRIDAVSTNVFEVMRKAYMAYLNSGAPKSGAYPLTSGTVVIDWRDVSTFRDWIEP